MKLFKNGITKPTIRSSVISIIVSFLLYLGHYLYQGKELQSLEYLFDSIFTGLFTIVAAWIFYALSKKTGTLGKALLFDLTGEPPSAELIEVERARLKKQRVVITRLIWAGILILLAVGVSMSYPYFEGQTLRNNPPAQFTVLVCILCWGVPLFMAGLNISLPVLAMALVGIGVGGEVVYVAAARAGFGALSGGIVSALIAWAVSWIERKNFALRPIDDNSPTLCEMALKGCKNDPLCFQYAAKVSKMDRDLTRAEAHLIWDRSKESVREKKKQAEVAKQQTVYSELKSIGREVAEGQ